MRPLAIATALVLSGCGDGDARGLDLCVVLPDGLATDAEAVETRIREGGCAGSVIFRDLIRAGEAGTQPPPLGPGLWGFEIIATDADCAVVARVCEEHSLPLADGEELCLTPAAASGACGGVCDDGACMPDPIMLDGGVADGCVPETEMPDCIDNDCDGLVDEDFFDLETDVENCGTCGSPCSTPDTSHHQGRECAGGACVHPCLDGWADCDGDPANGCEQALSDPAHCGSCGTACTGVTPECSMAGESWSCTTGCTAGLVSCDGLCVDLSSDDSHCGSCGNSCARPHATSSCEAGTCGPLVCDRVRLGVEWADCNGDRADGCEVDITSDPDNCATCGRRCAALPNVDPTSSFTCGRSVCGGLTCAPGYADCDGLPPTGCEARTDDPTTCGRACTSCMLPGEVCEFSPGPRGDYMCLPAPV